MGVTYKLTQEVVNYIIGERQAHPLFSCRQLAESASHRFGLNLSKSSVHDVLKESGIITPRGRKPKDKFSIPHEKKKQIQASLSHLLADPVAAVSQAKPVPLPAPSLPRAAEVSLEYAQAGKVFLQAALWDLGIFTEEGIKETDWGYYLTYAKGVEVFLENGKAFFIELALPVERCLKEVADGIINNVRPFIFDKVSSAELWEASMAASSGHKIEKISIVDRKTHILAEFENIMECNRTIIHRNRIFVETNEIEQKKRAKALFFPELIGAEEIMDNFLNLKGFDTIENLKKTVTLLAEETSDKEALKAASERLNNLCIYDGEGRLVNVKVK